MADRGAGEGSQAPISMPSPVGHGRGRGRAGTSAALQQAAVLSQQPQPGSPNNLNMSPNSAGNAPSPGRSGLRRPKVETQERLLPMGPSGGN